MNTARIDIVMTALDPLCHFEGASGNTQLLRRQSIVTPDGETARVPYISGNSLKHKLRDACARFAIEAMGVEQGTMSKAVVDLLFSGGALTKSGSRVDLRQARDLGELFPVLSLCGYSAGNTMRQSKVRVDNLHLVCAENAWRAPAGLRELPLARKRAALYSGEEFGTRHEATRQSGPWGLLTDGEKTRLTDEVSDKAAGKEGKLDTTQMIYDYQTIKPGSVLWGAMYLLDASDLEVAAFASGLSHMSEGQTDESLIMRVGAKGAVGHGRVAVRLHGQIRQKVHAPAWAEDGQIVPRITPSEAPHLDDYVSHLQTNRVEILAALEAAAK